jgi:hypothetical protein
MVAQQRMTTADWNQYDTRHTVFRPARMTSEELEQGYWRAYREFYRWGSIARGARAHGDLMAGLRHAAYAAGWKKFEPLWDVVIRAKRAGMMLPVLETIQSEFGKRSASAHAVEARVPDLELDREEGGHRGAVRHHDQDVVQRLVQIQ